MIYYVHSLFAVCVGSRQHRSNLALRENISIDGENVSRYTGEIKTPEKGGGNRMAEAESYESKAGGGLDNSVAVIESGVWHERSR